MASSDVPSAAITSIYGSTKSRILAQISFRSDVKPIAAEVEVSLNAPLSSRRTEASTMLVATSRNLRHSMNNLGASADGIVVSMSVTVYGSDQVRFLGSGADCKQEPRSLA